MVTKFSWILPVLEEALRNLIREGQSQRAVCPGRDDRGTIGIQLNFVAIGRKITNGGKIVGTSVGRGIIHEYGGRVRVPVWNEGSSDFSHVYSYSQIVIAIVLE